MRKMDANVKMTSYATAMDQVIWLKYVMAGMSESRMSRAENEQAAHGRIL